MPKQNTIKEIAKKVAFNGDENDYTHIPIGVDSDNADRPDGTTVEEGLSNLENSKIEFIQVTSLPTENIKTFPVIYAVVEKSSVTLYEYKNSTWVPYGGKPDFVGTYEELLAAIKSGEVTDGMTAFVLDGDGTGGSSGSGGSGGGSLVQIVLDDELSETSENGVKNKVIAAEFKKYVSKSGDEITGPLKVTTLILGTTPSDEIGAMWLELE